MYRLNHCQTTTHFAKVGVRLIPHLNSYGSMIYDVYVSVEANLSLKICRAIIDGITGDSVLLHFAQRLTLYRSYEKLGKGNWLNELAHQDAPRATQAVAETICAAIGQYLSAVAGKEVVRYITTVPQEDELYVTPPAMLPHEEGVLIIGNRVHHIIAAPTEVDLDAEQYYEQRSTAVTEAVLSRLRQATKVNRDLRGRIVALERTARWVPNVELRHLQAGIRLEFKDNATTVWIPFNIEFRELKYRNHLYVLRSPIPLAGFVGMFFLGHKWQSMFWVNADFTPLEHPHFNGSSTCFGQHRVGNMSTLDDVLEETRKALEVLAVINYDSLYNHTALPNQVEIKNDVRDNGYASSWVLPGGDQF